MIDWRDIDTFDGRKEPVLLCSTIVHDREGYPAATVCQWLYGPERKSERWFAGKATGEYDAMPVTVGSNWWLYQAGDYSQGNESMFDPTHWAPIDFPA